MREEEGAQADAKQQRGIGAVRGSIMAISCFVGLNMVYSY